MPGLATTKFRWTALIVEYAHRTASPSSLPIPDCFILAKGTRKSLLFFEFIQMFPSRSFCETRTARVTPVVNSVAASPYSVSLAALITSSSEVNLTTTANGPKISSWYTFIEGFTSPTTVGSIKYALLATSQNRGTLLPS